MAKKRILLKLSGEALGGQSGKKYDTKFIKMLTEDIARVYESNMELAIVVGAGNIFRGLSGEALNIKDSSADQMGMVATILNGIVLRDLLEKNGIPSTLMSMISCPQVCETFSPAKGKQVLSDKKILICAGGTGAPYFTTDTASAIKARELECDMLMKGTKVQGIFNKDPELHEDAEHFQNITYSEVLEKNLRVMDRTAFEIAQSHKIPIVVFSVFEQNPISSVLAKTCQYTVVNDKRTVTFGQ